MNTKNFWLACSIQENGKRYAYVVKAPQHDNLVSVMQRVKNLEIAEIYNSKKQAGEVVTFWNECYKNNGSYMFSEPF